MTWIVGVDVGGTFTDLFAIDRASGQAFVHKLPSQPDDPANAIMSGIEALAEASGLALNEIDFFSHGTTVGTNALIERRGADVALITTDGFRDLLEIGRQTRPKLYDLQVDHPPPLVPRKHRFEVSERLDAEGDTLIPLTPEAIEAMIDAVRASSATACAVCLLFAFRNGAHERALGEALQQAFPHMFISLSSDVHPEFREFERFSTTVLNAYLQPVVAPYIDALGAGLAKTSPKASVGINQSNGGLMSAATTARYPVRTVLSGPAAGVVGAVHTAREVGRADVITLDMGGTSADVCLIREHKAGMSFSRDVSGFPVRLPMVDINTVGAGGGSVAWFDRDGLMKVGPESAGADPGPACYGKGGVRPTVSDANAVLGRLSPNGLLGGAMDLDIDAARRAIGPTARQLDTSIERAAHGIVSIVVANMVRAIRAVSVERGHDPRDFVLMPFGGAGPLHATDVARAFGIREIIVPRDPGILCAQGLVFADRKEEFVRSSRLPLDQDGIEILSELTGALRRDATAWFDRDAATWKSNDHAQRSITIAYDMRYVGQNFELRVVDSEMSAQAPNIDRLKQLFFAVHDANYGFHNPDDAVEIINLRLTASIVEDEPILGELAHAEPARSESSRPIYFEAEQSRDAAIHQRRALVPGQVINGPAVIDQLDATTIVFPGDRAVVHPTGNLVLELAA